MTDQLERDLRTLLHGHASGAETPPLPLARITADGEAARATAVRRRTGLAAALAAAAAVAAITVPVALHGSAHRGAPAPAAPTPTTATRPPTDAEWIIGSGIPNTVDVGPDSQVAGLWSSCTTYCRVAWQLRSGTQTWSGMAHGADRVTAGAAGVVVTSMKNDRGFVVGYDGTTTPLRKAAAPRFDVGDVAIPRTNGMWLVDPELATWTPLTDDSSRPFDDAIVADETTWAERGEGGAVHLAWRIGNGPWSSRTLPGGSNVIGGPIAARGQRVAAATCAVAKDSVSVAALSVSSDGGRTWTDIPGSALPFADIVSMAVDADGVLYVWSTNGFFRSSDADWTTYTKLSAPADLMGIEALPDGTLVSQRRNDGPTAVVELRPQGDSALVARTLASFDH